MLICLILLLLWCIWLCRDWKRSAAFCISIISIIIFYLGIIIARLIIEYAFNM